MVSQVGGVVRAGPPMWRRRWRWKRLTWGVVCRRRRRFRPHRCLGWCPLLVRLWVVLAEVVVASGWLGRREVGGTVVVQEQWGFRLCRLVCLAGPFFACRGRPPSCPD